MTALKVIALIIGYLVIAVAVGIATGKALKRRGY